MANKYWTPMTEKVVVSVSMGLTGYSLMHPLITALPSLPVWVTNQLIPGASLLTLAGAMTLYGVFILWTKY